jgi:MFS family permease
MPAILRALNSRNARLYFSGQGISVIGTWMQTIALSWLVYRLTNSIFLLGVISFATQLPVFLLAPWAGVLIDRWPKRRLLVITQLVFMLLAFVLTALVYFQVVSAWQILLLGVIAGIANAFDLPARHTFLVEIIEHKNDLSNAIALNSAVVNGARLIGPSVAGLLIFSLGEGWCFFINGLSYLAVLLALLAMRLTKKTPVKNDQRLLAGLKEGLVYIYRLVPIRNALLLLALANLAATPYAILMPVFAKDILHGDSGTMGFLMAAAGIGALAGAIFLAAKKDAEGFGRIITLAAGLFGAGLILFSLSTNFWLSFAIMLLVGFGMMVQMAASNSLLQSIVDDDKRGRVMSFYSLAFIGMAMFGNLIISGLAQWWGAPMAVAVGGACLLLGSMAIVF